MDVIGSPGAQSGPRPRERFRGLAACVLTVAVALAVGWLVRVQGIEPPEPAWACQAAAPPWWCPFRTGAILVVQAGAVGLAALLAGASALWKGSRRAAMVALALGGVGLVLYAAEPASGGLLLGALALLSRR